MGSKISGYKKGESAVINYNDLRDAKMIMVLSGVCGIETTLKECLDGILRLNDTADKAKHEAEELHLNEKKRKRVSPVRTGKGRVG